MRISHSQDSIAQTQVFPICKTCLASIVIVVLIALGMIAKRCVNTSDFQGRNNGEALAHMSWSFAGLLVIGIALKYFYSAFLRDRISIPSAMRPYRSIQMQSEYNPI